MQISGRVGKEKKLMKYLFRRDVGSWLVLKRLSKLSRYFRNGCCEPFGVPPCNISVANLAIKAKAQGREGTFLSDEKAH